MAKWILDRIEKGVTSAITMVLIWPMFALIIWGSDRLGMLAWADVPSPSLRQIVLFGLAAAFLAS